METMIGIWEAMQKEEVFYMRILIIGGGGREHVLAWKLSMCSGVEEIFCIPGNAGIAAVARCVEGNIADHNYLLEFVKNKGIDFTIVGPEAPLVAGLVDRFQAENLLILGPEREAALLEGSKVWAKEFMQEWGIPTASFEVFSDFAAARKYVLDRKEGVVVKADGLAAGKGVTVAGSPDEAVDALEQAMVREVFKEAGRRVVIEEKLVGEEASLLAVTDGSDFYTMPSAQDHKPVGEGDTGPNTGGMGAYSPAPVMTPELTRAAEEKVFRPLLKGMQAKGLLFRGIIYAGLMITEAGPAVLEFNVRFGDPEAQALLPRLDADLSVVLKSAAAGKLQGEWQWKKEQAVCVVMASGGYPGSFQTGLPISGLDEDFGPGVEVFHAGTARKDGRVITAGGRVLGVTALHRDLREAVKLTYQAVEKINFPHAYYRRDIAHRALEK